MLAERQALKNLRARLPESVRYGAQVVYGLIPPELHHGSEYRRWRGLLEESEAWNAEQHEKAQSTALRAILEHCFRNVPYYRELAQTRSLRTIDFRRSEDLQALPLVTKEMLRDNPEKFRAENLRRSEMYYTTTGGSTGIPFGFYRSTHSLAREAALVAHFWGKHGYRPWKDRCTVLRGVFVGGPRGEWWQYNPFRKELHLSTYALTEQNALAYLEQARRYGTRFLQAYPSAATLLGKHLEAQGGGAGVFEAIFTASENLYEEQRDFLERVFGCPVVDFYGQAEQAALAQQCPESRQYHFSPHYGIVEFLRGDGSRADRPGELAEIVATGLINDATPMVRYRTRDLVVLGQGTCRCGWGGPFATRIEGRLQELVITPDGRRVSMTAINMHNDLFDRVLQFQFVQDRLDLVVLRLVPRSNYSEADSNRIREEIGGKLGASVRLEIERTERIDPGPSGKHRFLLQRLPKELLGQMWC